MESATLDFPFYSMLPLFGLFVALGGFVLLPIVLSLLAHARKDVGEGAAVTFQIAVGLVFLTVGVFGLVFGAKETYRFRSVKIDDVTALIVRTVPNELSDPVGSEVRIDDRKRIAEALGSLRSCFEISQEHEHFVHGYQIRFELNGARSAFAVLAMKESSAAGEAKPAVIPTSENAAPRWGVFGCPTFQEWVTDNIDPLFSTMQKP